MKYNIPQRLDRKTMYIITGQTRSSDEVQDFCIRFQFWLARRIVRLSQSHQPTSLTHRYRGGRIANCSEFAWKCRGACARHSGQKLLPVVVRKIVKSDHRARVVTGDEKQKSRARVLAGCHVGLMNLNTRFLLFCSYKYLFLPYGPFNCISFHKFSRQLPAFSLCSSGLISALPVLSAISLYESLPQP